MKIDLNKIIENHQNHSRLSDWWKQNSETVQTQLSQSVDDSGALNIEIENIQLSIPPVSFGAVSTKELFGLDELIIFGFYMANRKRYKLVADLGANIGIHSLILAKLGFEVESFEPDPHNSKVADSLLRVSNVIDAVVWHEKAVVASSSDLPKTEFVRVLGNTTSSHVKGAKEAPYGELEVFSVNTVLFDSIVSKVDLIKMDVEGLEPDLLESLTAQSLESTDIILEVGTESNARRIFEWANKVGISMFPQKINWTKATTLEELPISYKEGSLFLSKKAQMPWFG